jgi:hypothetical protein
MSAHEIYVRSSQELFKRWDTALVRGGRRWDLHPLALTGKFFFAPEQIPGIVEALRRDLPVEVDETVREAERICRHEFDILGFSGLRVGEEIDWHLDVVHGKRSPLKPWYQIPFLDFDVVGDHKIIWELSRHQHLVTLAKAWRFTADDRYLQELIRQWRHWRSANPYPLGINWASSLEVAFRSLAWVWIERLLDNGSFAAELRAAQGLNGRHIQRYLSTYFAPNTHLLGEAVALFFLGTLYGVSSWQRTGWRITLQEMERQVSPDGFHFEQSVYYHIYALDFFLHARRLAECNGITVPERYNVGLEAMLDALAGISQAGLPPRLGDDDGGRLFNPRRNRSRHMTDPLATGAVLFNRQAWNPGLVEETVWLVGPRALPSNRPACRSRAFSASGIHVMAANGWQLTIDAGPLGWGNGGHGHADLLSVQLTAGGREYLVDPGTGSYMQATERDWFRGTAAHNTLEVDGRSQAVPVGPFAWRAIPTVRVERWDTHPEFDYFCGSHDGYAPVLHRRHVVRAPGFWLVRDEIVGEGEHELAAWWHLASGTELTLVSTGEWERLDQNSMRSPAYGAIEEGPAICFRTRTRLPCEHTVAIVNGAATLVARDEPGARVFETCGRRVLFRDGGMVEVV